MSALNDALTQVGVDIAVDAASNLIGAISEYNAQNLSPGDLAAANAGMRILSQATGIGALSPGIVQNGKGGEWESLHYANDLNAHHPKFKFLFKVEFKGFPGGNFSYYIHRCDKPKVKFNHTDVNYYNFRTRVLTSVAFDPLTFTFLDEIGNTVNSFFTQYLAKRSKQGNGYASTIGGEQYSSSIPYTNGFSEGRKIEIQQIFANGLATNIFTLYNPKIEALEFDDLNMEISAGSMMVCTVTYDSISCETTGPYTINSWGNTDIYRGGGVAGTNGGESSTGPLVHSYANGNGIGGESPFISRQSQQSYQPTITGVNAASVVPAALADLVSTTIGGVSRFNQSSTVMSNGDVLSSSIQNTLIAITSGSNLKFGGFNG